MVSPLFLFYRVSLGNLGGFGDGDEDDFEFVDGGNQNVEDDYFDQVVGAMQEILMEAEFNQMLKKFNHEHCL